MTLWTHVTQNNVFYDLFAKHIIGLYRTIYSAKCETILYDVKKKIALFVGVGN